MPFAPELIQELFQEPEAVGDFVEGGGECGLVELLNTALRVIIYVAVVDGVLNRVALTVVHHAVARRVVVVACGRVAKGEFGDGSVAELGLRGIGARRALKARSEVGGRGIDTTPDGK